MREILFRGKTKANHIDDGYWLYGDLVHLVLNEGLVFMFNALEILEEVDPETVGQFTGLTDKKGKKIFEGDIVKTWQNNIGKIEFGQYWDEEIEGYFYGYAWIGKDEYEESITLSLDKYWDGHEVIGNIYDNKDLLKEV